MPSPALEPSVVQVWSRGLWARTTGAAAAAENDDDEQLFPASGETVTAMAAHVSEVGWRGEDDGDDISGGGVENKLEAKNERNGLVELMETGLVDRSPIFNFTILFNFHPPQLQTSISSVW
ncbi:hypothetical protein QVD17_28116 [Tagetes erecta]|uniref:Uncharacterized protein n=1 Tax=Tagetes erecta TaxID=13708 RepID=A0AAD8KEH2_TARER|nr:hypothetical protein QVD17_28116 [Tagetes erecta]